MTQILRRLSAAENAASVFGLGFVTGLGFAVLAWW
jgi:hypothetical protein